MATGLDERLYKNDINKENFNSLLREFKENPDIFLAFLGAGVSASLKGVPDLSELYDSCCEKNGYSKKTAAELPELFEALYAHIENKEDFDKELFEVVTPKNARSTSAHIEIARAFNCFVTTNYYDPIEDGFRQKQDLLKAKPETLTMWHLTFPPADESKYSLTYLHGNLRLGFCVLRKKDYQFFYPSLYERQFGVYVVENSLRKILTKWSAVFLGCSLEKHLKDFMQYLLGQFEKDDTEGAGGKAKNKMKTHYWVTSDSEIKKYLEGSPEKEKDAFEAKYFDNYARINIKPVIYSGDHIFVEDLCRTLAKTLETKTSSFAGETYDPAQRSGNL